MDRALRSKHSTDTVSLLFFSVVFLRTVLCVFNSHVEGHVVGVAIFVCIRDVMDSTYCQDNLSQCVNDGQVNNSPVQREEEEEGGVE